MPANRLVVEDHVIEITDLKSRCLQAPSQRMEGKSDLAVGACEPGFIGCRQDTAVDDERRSTVVKERRDAQYRGHRRYPRRTILQSVLPGVPHSVQRWYRSPAATAAGMSRCGGEAGLRSHARCRLKSWGAGVATARPRRRRAEDWVSCESVKHAEPLTERVASARLRRRARHGRLAAGMRVR
jgi:hypothetical protein